MKKSALLDHNSRPMEASFGRHVHRAGASLEGTMSNWATQTIGVRVAEQEKRRLSERAEDLFTNSAIAHGLLEGAVVETIGIGLTPQPSPMADWLGIDDEEWIEAYETQAENLFEIWGFDPRHYCCGQRRMNAYQQQAWTYFSWKLHGIGLMQVVFDKSPGRPFRFSLLPIDASRLQTPQKKHSGEVYDGVEVNKKTGAPEKLWIAKPTPAGRYSKTSQDFYELPIWNQATGLPQVLMTCDVRNVGEYKNDSLLAPIIKEIRDSDDFVDAALVKAVSQTLFSVYLTSTDPNGNYGGTPADPDANGNIDWETRIRELGKGMIIEGPPGSEPKMLDNNAAPQDYDTMWKSTVARVGMATQRGSENVLKKYEASFAASMANIISAEKFEDYDRMIHVTQHCQPALAWLLYESVLTGRLKVKSRQHFVDNLHAYTRANFLAPPQRRINSLNEASAEDKKLANHTLNYSDSFARRGRGWKKGLEQTAKEKKYLAFLQKKYGVDMTPPTPAGSAPGKPTDPDDTGDVKDSEDGDTK